MQARVQFNGLSGQEPVLDIGEPPIPQGEIHPILGLNTLTVDRDPCPSIGSIELPESGIIHLIAPVYAHGMRWACRHGTGGRVDAITGQNLPCDISHL
jgi:hypothetical protein